MDIKEILESHGYPIIDGGTYLSTKALFRGGDNPTAICIYQKDNLVIDFPNKERYDIKTLIGKILGIVDDEKIEEYIQKNDINIVSATAEIQEKLIYAPKKLHKKFLDELEPNHQYWVKRGINEDILKRLNGGIHNGRYYFPIWDSGSFVGLTGRDITGKSKVKWLHKGKKTEWVWPSIKSVVKVKEVVLVESPGDALTLMTCGIENVLCTFGADCSWRIINELLQIPKVKIYIAFNQDDAGETGAVITARKLGKYFDKRSINFKVPTRNDWNEILMRDGKKKLLSVWDNV
jgi:DNA primase